eukprot:8295066-Alexandrium_andersonii.AAC.1
MKLPGGGRHGVHRWGTAARSQATSEHTKRLQAFDACIGRPRKGLKGARRSFRGVDSAPLFAR